MTRTQARRLFGVVANLLVGPSLLAKLSFEGPIDKVLAPSCENWRLVARRGVAPRKRGRSFPRRYAPTRWPPSPFALPISP